MSFNPYYEKQKKDSHSVFEENLRRNNYGFLGRALETLIKPTVKLKSVVPDEEVLPFLLEHQRPHFLQLKEKIEKYGIGFDLSDTGTGKTYIALALCISFGLKAREVYVLTRKNAIKEWEQAVRHFEYKIFLRKNEMLLTHEGFTRRFFIKEYGFNKLKEKVEHRPIKLLILDECHKIRNRSNQLTRLAVALRTNTIHKSNVLMSSATLIETPDQMLSYMRMIATSFNFSSWFKISTKQGSIRWKTKQNYLNNKKARQFDSLFIETFFRSVF